MIVIAPFKRSYNREWIFLFQNLQRYGSFKTYTVPFWWKQTDNYSFDNILFLVEIKLIDLIYIYKILELLLHPIDRNHSRND